MFPTSTPNIAAFSTNLKIDVFPFWYGAKIVLLRPRPRIFAKMDSNQQELVAQFCGVTGANASSAQTALASANWNLEEAVALYFAAQEGGDEGEAEAPQASASAPTASAPQPSSGAARSRQPPQGRMRTLRDLQGGGNDDDDEDDGRDPQDFFAGGEKSGLAVQNPDRGQGGGDHFNNIMNQARQNRPRPPLGDDDDEDEAPQPERRSNFTGRAQTLGGDDAPSRTIEDPTAASSSSAIPQSAASLPRVTRTMHLWSDGVSIDDGPLFRFDDPANQQIMDQINRGQAPLHMLDVQPGQEVDLQLDPHKGENYVKPKPKYKPFSGSGQRLGSPTPGASSTMSAPSSSQPAAAQSSSSPASSAPTNEVDESQPVLTLQIRLGDGTRLQSRFNTSQTIGDVYEFVNRASTSSGQRAYALMTTFPSKELEDKSVVLGDMADFKRGGVVVQKWK